MNKILSSKTLLAASVLALVSCGNSRSSEKATAETPVEQTTPVMADTAKPATALFDGKSLAGWHGYNKTGAVKNWIIEDGSLVCLGAAQHDTGGDLATDKDYENFELSWDWKISKGGNSGVMYHVVEDAKYKGPYY